MHRDKTVARIVLVLSIVHGALAAPVAVQQRYLMQKSDDESPHPVSVASTPASHSEVALDELGDPYVTARSSPSGSNHYLTTPVSRARRNPPPASGTLQTRGNMPSVFEDNEDPQYHIDPPAGSGTSQVQNDLPGTSGTSPSQDHPPPGPGTPQLHTDPPPTSGGPSSQNDPSPASGDPQLHNYPTTSRFGTPQGHNDLSPGELDESYRWVEDLFHVHGLTASEPSFSESDPVAPGVEHSESQVHNNPPAESGGLQVQGNPANSEAKGFFNGAGKKTLKVLGGIGAVVGISAAIFYGVHKLAVGPGSKPGSGVSGSHSGGAGEGGGAR